MNMTNKIEFTEEAIKQINKIVSKNGEKKYFRISVKGGGCSGFKYNFTFEDKIEKEDLIFNNTLIDKSSLEIIKGSIVDYKKEMIGDSFVINNPKASSSCGCGLSFSI
mgnify:FL=1|jgi:iron-sulfur cluster insertion protein|tara:strand:+ start:160 stop:483 length:324 start_codon:yes stop_codon:yes gene_type:complete